MAEAAGGIRLEGPGEVDEEIRPRGGIELWDLVVQGCGVRISGATKSCVISVWTGGRLKFETLGRVSPESSYGFLREQAIKRIGDLKRERLPPVMSICDPEALAGYIGAHPELSPRTAADYREWLERGFGPQVDQPVARLVTAEILRLNAEHLKMLAEKDPDHQPPKGFWAWQGKLRVLRPTIFAGCSRAWAPRL